MADKIVLYRELDQRHYPAPDGYIPDALSKEGGNLNRFGNDGGVYIDANDILSNQAGNILGISIIDGRVYLGSTIGIIDISDYVDEDTCNKLRVTDNRLGLFAEDLISNDAGNIIIQGSDCGLYAPASSAAVSEIYSPELIDAGDGFFNWELITHPGPVLIQIYFVNDVDEYMPVTPRQTIYNPSTGTFSFMLNNEFGSLTTMPAGKFVAYYI